MHRRLPPVHIRLQNFISEHLDAAPTEAENLHPKLAKALKSALLPVHAYKCGISLHRLIFKSPVSDRWKS